MDSASFPSASVFSLPLPPWQQPLSARVARYEPRKRKKDSDDWGDDDEDLEGETTDAVSEATPAPSLILSPDEAHQYRVAGLSFDKELPGGQFPHAAPRDENSKREMPGDVLKGLSSLSPPIFPPQSAAHRGNLRLQHFAVITAILHRSLLKGDYIRAGRAWGLILREEFGGSPIDVRTEGRWGIGAEILLRRGRQISSISSGSGRTAEEINQPENTPKLCFTRKGFEDARQYYETLVIQHPYRKAAPDAISPLHFYPAMFGLWVYVTQEESNVAREDLQRHHEELSEESSEDEDAASEFENRPGSGRRRKYFIAEIRAKELEQAQQIAARMDEVMVSPPYSDSPELLELRGMVSLWIADLLVSCLPQEERDEHDFENGASSPNEDLSGSIQARREQRFAREKRQLEVQKSKEFLEKANQRGRGVSYSLENFHIDDGSTLLE
ncbi:hypothetical protein ASPWEDRAFT_44183 [Aspergillus wentii DTO 134E9]|uniref:Transcription initiation factor Rrn11 n=1 Tax=Aspergillus wentii DTO 134E9 TaxID=1073089 RepID=A0A1L9RB27_ASPWE|nr:uncharacterized protein ASPWEDRAFT_44183 [Aspergillus wentii DTO 134E9]KAI9934706.1 hypothetical protein MW887_000323 [Aspergillus wentii]OJJ32132.1 hypothetical protein ASPWEDRAFT_44183 [Aspergillus wentii DTO 134E9]